ncbi:hypothetical protein K450DRAFT_258196 [Umbelopsis ramanniana AG]|uniref:Vacuolar membrane protein n=1 Tax=Umbelopsis ramanniana AG TaxID=1314678 RepID=A0AAD5E3R1_UMBRA|nr:uncharacterized protein K450DRAFT_258196 [Umbelopsis ramanniana AG]KAI8576139.1 hypothetical protein K450DRAFT_258196 [Umbelopsis ramanniana AG]
MSIESLIARAPGDEVNQSGCKLLDSFAIVIQVCLATIAFSTLIIKRQRENPQRPVRIWGFDVSKQLVGGIVIHTLNLLVSYISGKNEADPSNPCVWYFLNIFVDTTVGVGILWGILLGFRRLAAYFRLQGVQSGVYGDPPLINQFIQWGKQLLIYITALVLMKLVVVLIFAICPFLFDFGQWVLEWTMSNYKLQVVFVMLIFPLVMNIIQFWVIDTIVKHNEKQEISLGDHVEEDEFANLLDSVDETELAEHVGDLRADARSPSPGALELNANPKFKPSFAIDDDEADFDNDGWDEDNSFQARHSEDNAGNPHQDLYELDNGLPKRS